MPGGSKVRQHYLDPDDRHRPLMLRHQHLTLVGGLILRKLGQYEEEVGCEKVMSSLGISEISAGRQNGE